MRVPLTKLLQALGVGRVLYPYETQPWFLQDDETTRMCSAEVRMGPGAEDLEAEIQILEEKEDSDGDTQMTPNQIFLMRAMPTGSEWTVRGMWVKGENYENKIFNWEQKGCDFFLNFVQSIQMGEIPDIDVLIEKELNEDGGDVKGGRGRIGRKSPKAKASAILGMKK